ncbi:putative DNA-binding transcriptional regulator YafY [Alkalihalobacillus xiaoxiensis]|uniref:DNA-binding transcriptional regulator YafY n=1 Tax=Shouchella xiaoxiensis TaxID=766895 RepID=A0ABS2SMS5_9BACI|nr:YafY family protein [Shouchella xiaoxiensis]MBM7836815.1 putative DNA-binding transcriptional regulator YafY [Shouchella xiaoxiensis]
MRLDRLLGITVQLLASRKRVTAPELAQQFEVSVRTIYRDIDVLAQAGIPIVAHAGVEGGFEIMEQFALSKQLFSLAELSFLYQLLEKMEFQPSQAVRDKLAAIQPLVTEQANNQVLLSLSSHEQERSFIQSWLDALSKKKLVSFQYCDAKGNESERTVEPRNVLYEAGRWYGEGYCRSRKADRVFRLARMTDLVILKDSFIEREKQPDQAFVSLEMVHLRFSLEVEKRVREQFFEGVEAHKAWIDVQMPLYDELYAIQLCLSYGASAELIAPTRLRHVLLKELEAIKHKYEG